MATIFVRERRRYGQGSGKPRFMVVAVLGTDLKVYAPHLRKVELEKLGESVGAEIVYLPRGEQEGEQGESGGGQGRRRRQHD